MPEPQTHRHHPVFEPVIAGDIAPRCVLPALDSAEVVSRFGGTVRERAVPIWKTVAAHLTQEWKWLNDLREPVHWKTTRTKVAAMLRLPRTIALLATAAVFVGLSIFISVAWRWYSEERIINGA